MRSGEFRDTESGGLLRLHRVVCHPVSMQRSSQLAWISGTVRLKGGSDPLGLMKTSYTDATTLPARG